MKKTLLFLLIGIYTGVSAQVNFPKDTVNFAIEDNINLVNDRTIIITNRNSGVMLDYNYSIFHDDFKSTPGWDVMFTDCNASYERYALTGSCKGLKVGENWLFAISVVTGKAYANKYFSIGFINPNDSTDADTLTIRTKFGYLYGNQLYNSINENIILAPNPASDQMTVSFNSIPGEVYQLSIINLLGETVEQYSILGNNQVSATDVDVTKLEAGIYTVILNHGSNVKRRKLVVNQ